ncbi:MAG: chemotaxis protein CheW [Myxococcota bacterium]|nr:chemotaxis protein CheW [Myxococcota bacterium]
MAAASSFSAEDPVADLACLEAGGQRYGVDVVLVREIVRAPELTPLPRSPELVEGVIDLRGAVIPVVDLGRALGSGSCADGLHVVVLEIDDMVLGLRVDAAVDVLSVLPDSLGEPPALTTAAGYELVRAIVRQPSGHPVLALAPEQLVERIYRSALDREGAA